MSKKKAIRPIVKTHGGKYFLREFIIEHLPPDYENLVYCEPMCAGASILLNKNPSQLELVNDLDKGITCIFKALRDEPKEFIDRIKKIRYTERTFKMALNKDPKELEDYIDKAVNEYCIRRMSRGGMKKAFAWSDRQRGGKPGDVNAWETMIKELPIIAERIKNVVILNKNVFDILKVWDEDNTIWYLDPPYLPSTRSDGATEIYEHEMSVDNHIDLLNFAKNARGKIIISGYSSPLYNRNLKGWKCKKKNVANHSAQTKTKDRRIETIWFNY